MAVLTDDERTELRRRIAIRMRAHQIDYSKAQLNSAMQALEDWYTNTGATAIAGIIEGAVPTQWDGPEKAILASEYFRVKARLGGAV